MAVLGLDTLFKFSLFCLYIGLWTLVSILVHVSQHTSQPAYNSSTAVLFTEVIKLGISIVLYLARDGSTMDLVKSVCASSRTLALYAVPGALYCAYNNLLYYNLSVLDPGSYNMLMQLRIVATVALHSAVFSIRLRGLQWIALLLICAGTLFAPPGACLLCPLPVIMCLLPTGIVLKEAEKNLVFTDRILPERLVSHGIAEHGGYALVLLQVLCSSFAGVYTERLLKGATPSVNVQNAALYMWTIACNTGWMWCRGTLGDASRPSNLRVLVSPMVFTVILMSAFGGIVTGFFLKHLDSIRRTIASAIEVFVCLLAAWLLFGVPLTAATIVAAGFVSTGVCLYSSTDSQRYLSCKGSVWLWICVGVLAVTAHYLDPASPVAQAKPSTSSSSLSRSPSMSRSQRHGRLSNASLSRFNAHPKSPKRGARERTPRERAPNATSYIRHVHRPSSRPHFSKAQATLLRRVRFHRAIQVRRV